MEQTNMRRYIIVIAAIIGYTAGNGDTWPCNKEVAIKSLAQKVQINTWPPFEKGRYCQVRKP